MAKKIWWQTWLDEGLKPKDWSYEDRHDAIRDGTKPPPGSYTPPADPTLYAAPVVTPVSFSLFDRREQERRAQHLAANRVLEDAGIRKRW